MITDELPLFQARAANATDEDDARTLRFFLRGRGWMLSKEIIFEFPAWKERYVRELAALSQGHVVSGQKGYKLTVECTPEEARHAANWLRSQANEMIARSMAISRVFHGAATNRAVAGESVNQ